MSRFRYYMRVLGGMRLSRFRPILDRAHDLSGRSRLWLAADMVRCAVRYGAGYHDYIQFGMYALTEKQKATMVTRIVSRKLMDCLNDEHYAPNIEDKGLFAKLYAPYIRRDVLVPGEASEEEIADFLANHGRIFCKPRTGSCGHGCFLYDVPKGVAPATVKAALEAKGDLVWEEVLAQHPALAAFNPASLNCIRIVTLIDSGGTPHVIYAVQKFGVEDVCVDNYGPGGIGCRVDLDTGRVLWPGVLGEGYMREAYTHHPRSGLPLLGFEVPFFKEACQMCLDAAMVTPQLRYVGWDVGIGPDGPAIVEGNDFTDYLFYQHVPQTPDGVGMLPVFLKYVPEFKR